MTPRHRRRLGVSLVGVALLLPLLVTAPASGNPIAEKREEARRLAVKIDALGEKVSTLDEEYNVAQLRLSKLREQLAVTKAKADDAAMRFHTVRARARARAVEAYVSGGALRHAASLVQSLSSDLVVRKQYLATIAGDDRELLNALGGARADLGDQQAALAKERDQTTAAAAALSASRDAAARAVSEQRAVLARVTGELDGLVREEQARLAAESAQRAQAQRASRAIARGGLAGDAARAGSGAGRTNPAPVMSRGSSRGAAAAVAFARAQLGKPYQWGAAGPDSYDCSGLTMRAWAQGGVTLPHSAGGQYSAIPHVSTSGIRAGDLVFFGSPIHHVGIAVDGGTMIDAPHTGAVVRYTPIFRSDLVGAGRPG